MRWSGCLLPWLPDSPGLAAKGAMEAMATDEFGEADLRKATIGEPVRIDGAIVLAEYDAAWPDHFAREAARIRTALGDRALRIEHVGSTAVPGLAAKPLIDVLLVVADSADEPTYVPDLEAVGFVLRIREPDWHEHRVLKRTAIDVNLHVFSVGSSEIERMLRFRDWLRGNPADRELYERTKREMAGRHWRYVQNYADAKTEVVEAIVARAEASAEAQSRAPR